MELVVQDVATQRRRGCDVEAPIAPVSFVEHGLQGKVEGCGQWREYYDAYARYASCYEGWLHVRRGVAEGVCSSYDVGSIAPKGVLRRGGNVASGDGTIVGDIDKGAAVYTAFDCGRAEADVVSVYSQCGQGEFGQLAEDKYAGQARCDGFDRFAAGPGTHAVDEPACAVVGDASDTREASEACGRSLVNVELGERGEGKYVPPFKRGPKGGRSIGRGPNYSKNQAARERRAAVKRSGQSSIGGYIDKGKYNNKASFFDGLPKEQVDELQRTRAEALLQKNLAEVTRQRTAAMRATAEEDLLKRELESGAFENRIRTRNEAMDRRSQDQSENIEFYRHTRGWAETVKSGEPSSARGPSNVPSLSSGGSPRSESDWELEVKRRDEQNESLRKELDQARKELETYEQSAYDPMKGVVSVYEPCEYVMDGASRFDQAGFMEEYRQKDRARDFSVPLGTHIRPKEEVKLVGM